MQHFRRSRPSVVLICFATQNTPISGFEQHFRGIRPCPQNASISDLFCRTPTPSSSSNCWSLQAPCKSSHVLHAFASQCRAPAHQHKPPMLAPLQVLTFLHAEFAHQVPCVQHFRRSRPSVVLICFATQKSPISSLECSISAEVVHQ